MEQERCAINASHQAEEVLRKYWTSETCPKTSRCLSITSSSNSRRLALSKIEYEVGGPSPLRLSGSRKVSNRALPGIRAVPWERWLPSREFRENRQDEWSNETWDCLRCNAGKNSAWQILPRNKAHEKSCIASEAQSSLLGQCALYWWEVVHSKRFINNKIKSSYALVQKTSDMFRALKNPKLWWSGLECLQRRKLHLCLSQQEPKSMLQAMLILY